MKKNVNLEYIRVFAILLVLYNHLYCYDFFMFQKSFGILHYILLVPSIICKCGSPLFFMISGALLLGKKEDYIYTLKHRVSRILVVMLVISLINTISNFTIYNFITYFFSQLNWYFYAYLAFLLLLPLFKTLALYFTDGEWKWFILIVFITNFIMPFTKLAQLNVHALGNMSFVVTDWPSSCWQFIFPLLGYFFYTKKELFSNTKVYFWAFISVVCSFLCIIYDTKVNSGENFELLHQYFTVIPTVALFIFLNSLRITNKTFEKIVLFLSPLTFGIFILDTSTYIRGYLYEDIINFIPSVGKMVGSILCVLIEIIVYVLIIYVLRLIPIVRKYL